MAVITVGTAPSAGSGGLQFGGSTLINVTSSSNNTGIIDTVQLYFSSASNGNNIKIGTFRSDGAGKYTCMSVTSSMNIGAASADTTKTISGLSLSISSGHFIGIYTPGTTTGSLAITDAGTNALYKTGDNTANGSQTYASAGTYTRNIRIYGTGSTLTSPTITTQAVSDITKDSATGNGNITDTGGINPHSRGIAYMPASSGDISFIPLPNNSFEDSTLVWGGVGTLARSSEQAKYGTYSMKVSWTSGSEAYGEIHPTPATYSGKKITFSAWVWSSVANMACLNIYDNAGAGYEAVQSAYHPGDSTWRLLTVSKTLRSGLTDLILRCRIATGSANSAYFDGVLSPYSDSVSPTLAIDSGNYSTGAFTKALTGLTPNTDYRAVAFAQNSVGVGNGSTVGFTTLKADESNFFQLF